MSWELFLQIDLNPLGIHPPWSLAFNKYTSLGTVQVTSLQLIHRDNRKSLWQMSLWLPYPMSRTFFWPTSTSQKKKQLICLEWPVFSDPILTPDDHAYFPLSPQSPTSQLSYKTPGVGGGVCSIPRFPPWKAKHLPFFRCAQFPRDAYGDLAISLRHLLSAPTRWPPQISAPPWARVPQTRFSYPSPTILLSDQVGLCGLSLNSHEHYTTCTSLQTCTFLFSLQKQL